MNEAQVVSTEYMDHPEQDQPIEPARPQQCPPELASRRKTQQLVGKVVQNELKEVIDSFKDGADETVTLNNFVDMLCQLEIFRFFKVDLEEYIAGLPRESVTHVAKVQAQQNREINAMSHFMGTFTRHFVLLHKNNEGKLAAAVAQEFLQVVLDRQQCAQTMTYRFVENISGHLTQQNQITEEGLNDLIGLFREFKDILDTNQPFNQFRQHALQNQRKNHRVKDCPAKTVPRKDKYQQAASEYLSRQKQQVHPDDAVPPQDRLMQLYQHDQVQRDRRTMAQQKANATALSQENTLYKYHPTINSRSQKIVSRMQDRQQAPGHRLFHLSRQHQEERRQKQDSTQLHRLHQEIKECTFTPSLVSAHRPRPPSQVKGADKAVQRMDRARKERLEKQQSYEQLGQVQVKARRKGSHQMVLSGIPLEQSRQAWRQAGDSLETEQSLEENSLIRSSLQDIQHQKKLIQQQFMQLEQKERQLKSKQRISPQKKCPMPPQGVPQTLEVELAVAPGQKGTLVLSSHLPSAVIAHQFIKQYGLSPECQSQFQAIVQQFQSQYFGNKST